MTAYEVRWTTEDIWADDPLSAALEAWDMLRDPEAFPPVFEVRTDEESPVEVDLRDDTIRPVGTAGQVLRAALAGYGVTVHTDGVGLSFAIPLAPASLAEEVYSLPHLLVADRSPSVHHDAAAHTGWMVWLHDENGEPVGDPLYTGGNGEVVDCAAESAAAAAFIADWLTAPRG